MLCFYKKTFLKDLTKLHLQDRKKIENLVFANIPKLNNIFGTQDIKKMKGYKEYYWIRIGDYRIGCKIEGQEITFYRVKSRDDIYRVFP